MTSRLDGSRRGKNVDEFDGDSVVSFASGPVAAKPLVKHAWSANDKVSAHQQTEGFVSMPPETNQVYM